MLVLSVHSCPDIERIGEYTFYFPTVKISRHTLNSHLPLRDPSIGKKILCLRDQPDGILIWEEAGGFYYSNDKKMSGRKLHHAGDTFGVGECRFEIKSHLPIPALQDIESRYHFLTEKHPFMADLFWALKQEMLHIEKNGKS